MQESNAETSPRLPALDRGEPNIPRGLALCFSRSHTAKVTRVAWSPQGDVLACPCRDARIYLYDAWSGETLNVLEGHNAEVLTVAWSPDGKQLASGGYDEVVRIWDIASGLQSQEPLSRHRAEVHTVDWSRDGRWLCASSGDGRVRIWKTEDFSLETELNQPGCLHHRFSPDSSLLATVVAKGKILVWDTQRRSYRSVLAGDASKKAWVLAWDPEGWHIAAGGADRCVRVWDVAATKQITHPIHYIGAVVGLDFSCDARLLASKGRDHRVRLVCCDRWREVAVLNERTAFEGRCVGLAFHPRDARLATLGSGDFSLRVWKLDLESLLGDTSNPDRL